MSNLWIDPLDAYRRPFPVTPRPIPGDPYDGPTPDLDDLPQPDVERLDRLAEERTSDIFPRANR